ncbi:ImcF-like family protein, partial [Pseudomonas syringae pv. actinidiae ICMP 18807]
SKAAVNGLVLVVSLPELLAASAAERNEMGARLVSRIEEYTDCLDANPPIYLMLTKTDQLPGFSQAFDGLDLHERQQPLGMTFGLTEITAESLRTVLKTKLANLQAHVGRHVDSQMTALGANANSALLNFPSYFAELSTVLDEFLQHFARSNVNGNPLLLRGLYFTSALQTEKQLTPVYEDDLAESFALLPASEAAALEQEQNRKTGDRSYFITDTFRRVIFPDRDLTLYQSRHGRDRSVGPIAIAVALLAGLAFIGWQTLSFQNNRQWLASINQQLTELEQSPDRAQRLASGQGLELLRNQLAAIEKYRTKGVPLQLSGGLYRGDDIYLATQTAYLQQLRTQALEPITLKLQLQMREFNEFAKTMDPQYGFGAAPAGSEGKTGKARAQGQKLLDRGARNLAAGRPTSLSGIPRST